MGSMDVHTHAHKRTCARITHTAYAHAHTHTCGEFRNVLASDQQTSCSTIHTFLPPMVCSDSRFPPYAWTHPQHLKQSRH